MQLSAQVKTALDYIQSIDVSAIEHQMTAGGSQCLFPNSNFNK